MKGCWIINPLGDRYWPDWKLMRDHGVTRLYFPTLVKDETTGKYVKNPKNTKDYRDGVHLQHFEYGLYDDPSWDWDHSGGSATATANRMRQAHYDCGGSDGVQFDYEGEDMAFIENMVRSWRTLAPKGPISWTLEPNQGGLIPKNGSLVKLINSDPNCVVVPQNFYGYPDMAPFDSAPYTRLRDNLISRGVATSRVKVFYDAQQPLPSTWDGCILSYERLGGG